MCSIGKGAVSSHHGFEIENPPSDGIYKTHIQNNELYSELNGIFTRILKRNDKLATHTNRKSAYLISSLRGAAATSVMLAADHDCYAVAARYMRDAEAVVSVNQVYNDPRQAVGTWKQPHCLGDETAVRACRNGAQWQKPLPVLVVGFMENLVGINPADPRRNDIKYVCEEVVKWKKVDTNPTEQLTLSIVRFLLGW